MKYLLVVAGLILACAIGFALSQLALIDQMNRAYDRRLVIESEVTRRDLQMIRLQAEVMEGTTPSERVVLIRGEKGQLQDEIDVLMVHRRAMWKQQVDRSSWILLPWSVSRKLLREGIAEDFMDDVFEIRR